jgi:putative FmdB family regulatory protein
MPLYDLMCEDCKHEYEVLMSMSETVLPKCPECGSKEVRRLVSAPSFSLKGGGWARDGYAKRGK